MTDNLNDPKLNATRTPSSDAPDWQDTWNRNVREIDNNLEEFFRNAGDKAESMMDQAKLKVQEMLDKTDMDEKARANWDKAKADSKLFGAKVENRIQHLVADGKIAWAKMTKKDETS